MWNSNGEIQQTKPLSFNSFSDQDGEIVSWTNIKCLTEDLNGNVWMGSTEGICVFNPALAFKEGNAFSVTRPKIPRNDGTNLADYLLGTERINAIAVDGANRKWMGTESSGLYLLSEDGLETLEHFTTDNSPLPSNQILSIAIDPRSGRVFVGTGAGLVSYQGDATEGEESLSQETLYAYPNPVRPEYQGVITIAGLM
jgi:ligand-binding sensor domain-containing protein